MHFMKKIFKNKIDDLVHEQFVRFSVGDYYPRGVIDIKVGKKATKFTSGFEFANDFIKFLTENVKGTVEVNGKVFSKKDFESDLVEEKKKKKGFYVGLIKQSIPIKKLTELYNQLKEGSYLLLNIKNEDLNLKIHQSPHNPRGKYKENFCKFSLQGGLAKKAIDEFAFDVKTDFKRTTIKHRFLINDIEIPKEFENDMAMARLMSKRVGKIVRELSIDGKESQKEIKLKA